jgi:serine/threonine protein kinase
MEDLDTGVLIGEGSGGTVHSIKDNEFVVKVVDIYNQPRAYGELQHEIKVYKTLSKLNLEFVPKYYFDKRIYGLHLMAIEYIDGEHCDLTKSRELKNKVDEYQRKLRSHGIHHLDLRPQNVLMTSAGDIKIIDFGQCKLDHDPESLYD